MSHLFAQADAVRLPLADESCDLVLGSPPYTSSRLYLENGRDLGIARDQFAWVDWMLGVTREALRVTRGAVIWVCAGKTEDRNYWPACEGLLWEAHKAGILSECPVYWHRVGIPGSGGDQWFRKDIEYCLCFKRSPVLPYSDNTACGHAPKWAPGGEMSNRLSDGKRRTQWGGSYKNSANRKANGDREIPGRPSHRIHTKRDANGVMAEQAYGPPSIANPGTYLSIEDPHSSVVHAKVGGGHLGHPIAHSNEAPFPEALAEFFIKSLCPPNGTVLDCFSGSGTTVATAERLGRNGIGFDLRRSQCRLGVQRLTRPHAPVVKSHKAAPMPLFGEE